MKRMTRPAALAAILTVALGVGLVAGCGGGSSSSGSATAIPLSGRVLQTGDLPGFTARPAEIMGLELVDEISDFESADADKVALTDAGFTRGALGRLDADENPDDSYAISFALKLDSAASAGKVLDHFHAQLLDSGDEDITATDLPVTGIPGAKGVTVAGANSAGRQIRGAAIAFADGNFVYGIQVVRTTESSQAGDATEAALRLYARVRGAPLAPEPTTSTTPTTPTVTVTTTTPTETTAAEFPDAGEQALLEHVPSASRSACARTSDTGRAREATSSVRCDLEGDELIVYYEQFEDAAAANRSYQSYVSANDIPANSGSCDGNLPSERSYSGDTGRVTCWRDSGRVWVAWSHDALAMVSVATRGDGDADELSQWWKGSESGPVE